MARKSALSAVKTYFAEAVRSGIDFIDPVGYGTADDEILNTRKALAQVGSVDASREELLRRLKGFKYPYPHGTKKGATFFDHVTKIGLLEFLTTAPFLYVVRSVWQLQLIHPLEREQYEQKISEYGYPLAVHRQFMYEVVNDLEQISKITAKYDLPEKWLVKCRTKLLRELRRQVSVLYYGGGLIGLYKARDRHEPRLYDSENQKIVLEELMREFKKRHMKKTEQLACQLTALICSDWVYLANQVLSPPPETVRSIIRSQKSQPASR
jgi:hypothetical protein